ncbi:MAG: substrate-binding domain-containing protein [Chthoniobacteraceae bacterium]
MSSSIRLLIVVLAVAGIGAGVALWKATHEDALVVYCAHDAIFAEGILRQFERESGRPLVIRYDTEATKSLGLVEMLISERASPRCDVFWNNEVLGTMDLAERGALAAYCGSGWERMPAVSKDADGLWTGFAARMRVVILGKNLSPDDEARMAMFSRGPELPAGSLATFAMAKPLFGTTLTHYVVLWKLWGAERLKAWHHDARARGLREVNGNSAVKDLVANGICAAGFTDTDDFFVAQDAGAPVRLSPIQIATGDAESRTVVIPNTVALIRGARHPEAGRALIDFLLSAETEIALAKSESRQIPLGPIPPGSLPEEVTELKKLAAKSVPLDDLLTARRECLAWLKSEYTK